MIYFLYLISLLMLFGGAWMIFSPDSAKTMCAKAKQIKNVKWFAAKDFFIAFVLIVGAGHTAPPVFTQVLGVIALAKGAAVLFYKREKIIELIDWWLSTPVLATRFIGLLTGGLGLILFKIII